MQTIISMKDITNKRLEQILCEAALQIKTLIHERGDDIHKAWNETIEEAHENNKDVIPPLKLAFGVTVDLDNYNVESNIRFTCAYTSKLSSDLPDPNQPDLFNGEEGE